MKFIRGRVRTVSDMSIIVGNRFITFIWSCTNFLVPKTNGLLLSFKSLKKPQYLGADA